MIDQLLNSTSIPLLEKMAMFTERRQNVLAGNIANLDTDNYRMQDLPTADFQHALRAAIQRRNAPGFQQSMNQATPYSESSMGQASFMPKLETAQIPAMTESIDDLFTHDLFQAEEADPDNVIFRDGNNRSVETEMMKMTKNSMMHQFAVEMMSIQMRMLESVVRERV